jgi:hypothetical protein
MEGFEGPHCEIIGIGFYGNGWALYPTIAACEEAHLSLELEPHREDGLVFYVGPIVPNPRLDVQGKSKHSSCFASCNRFLLWPVHPCTNQNGSWAG